QKLSERRAEAIMAHLTGTLGIPVERVRSEGRGESDLLVDENSLANGLKDAAQRVNRRIVFSVE
ncbi:MAG: OmpA family protein, partial [Candidatus Margulisiibacteriota bacterium]